MLPNWMMEKDIYVPPDDGGTFIVKTIKSLGKVMTRIRVQKGHEKKYHLPAIVKLFLMILLILVTAVSHNKIVIMGLYALFLLYLCTWPAIDIWNVLKSGLAAMTLSLLIYVPAMIVNPQGAGNNLMVIAKVFLSVCFVSVFNHTTQWNHITQALKRLHVPGIFIFTIDISLKYIVLLGNLISELLTSLQLKSVGKNNKKYTSVGGVMGIAFIRGVELNTQMYEAMQCRGFTDDYT